ncbi:MAG TPA: MBL fold metallo-hydrolase, partial [Methylomirabilota bacterium]|nr:MBL fold metallo-hydrolase [Methylomirabilota bacterium]
MSPGGGGGPARPLTLTFLGTRGGIEARSRRHARHSVLRVAHRGRTVLLDCGADWRGRVRRLAPDAILLTHAHPDHAGGLAGGAPCPVYAVAATWATLRAAAVTDRRVLTPRRHHRVAGLAVQAFPLVHSQRAPAVGYRIRAGGAAFFYAPDVAALPAARAALRGLA